MLKNRKITCPRCGKDTVYGPENPWRPFCSESCRSIDLGAWASDEYVIPDKDAVAEEPLEQEPQNDMVRH